MEKSILFYVAIIGMGLWFLFPLGLFMAMNSIDRYGEKLVKFGQKDKAQVPRKVVKTKHRTKQHRPQRWQKHGLA